MVADGCWWIAGNDLQAVHQTSKVASTCNFLGCSKENRNWLKNHWWSQVTAAVPSGVVRQRWEDLFCVHRCILDSDLQAPLGGSSLERTTMVGWDVQSRTVSYSFVVHTHIAHMPNVHNQDFFFASTRREIHTHMHLISIWEADASDACVPRANRCATPGSIMGIGPCILTKVFCALFMGDARWVIGWAMVGRAEFAPLILERS